MRERIESIGGIFAQGYHAALLLGRAEGLPEKLGSIPSEFQGFAYEGAAMGLGLLDRLTPWRRDRIQTFLGGPGAEHTYMVHVALGWALARCPGSVEKTIANLDPILRWLVLDGYGFHEGFFHWPRYLRGQPLPKRVTGYAARAFDQGLGRSLWFVDGGDVSLLWQTVAVFPLARQADLWSGIGLASVYAGEVPIPDLIALRRSAGGFSAQLAQGAAFAAKARHRARNAVPYTEQACWALCDMSSADAALVTDEMLENVPSNGSEPAFEIWRQRIQKRFARQNHVGP